jgi:hypothetical protein
MTTGNFCFYLQKQTNPNQSNKEVNRTVILPPLVFPAQMLVAKVHFIQTPNKESNLEKVIVNTEEVI